MESNDVSWGIRGRFGRAPNEEGVLLRYVPFRVVPSIVGAGTRHDAVGSSGAQHFALRDVPRGSSSPAKSDDGNNDAGGGMRSRHLGRRRGAAGDAPRPPPESDRPDVVVASSEDGGHRRRPSRGRACKFDGRTSRVAVTASPPPDCYRGTSATFAIVRTDPNTGDFASGNRTFRRDAYDTGAPGGVVGVGLRGKVRMHGMFLARRMPTGYGGWRTRYRSWRER